MRPQLVLSEDQIQERFKNLDKERKKKKTQKSRKPVQDLPRYVLILHEYYTKIKSLNLHLDNQTLATMKARQVIR